MTARYPTCRHTVEVHATKYIQLLEILYSNIEDPIPTVLRNIDQEHVHVRVQPVLNKYVHANGKPLHAV